MEKISILFWKRPSKDQSKETSVTCRITVNGLREEFATLVKANNLNWNQDKQRLKGTSQEVYTANRLLDQIKNKINDICSDLIRFDTPITAAELKYKLKGGDLSNSKYNIIALYREEKERMESLKGVDYSNQTIIDLGSAITSMRYFLEDTYNVNDISISRVDYDFIKKFETWGKTVEKEYSDGWKKIKWKTNSFIQKLSPLKKATRECFKKGIIKSYPFADYSIKRDDPNFKYLSLDEVEKIEQHEFESSISKSRDFFIFCCYTGLAYVDLKKISKQDIVIDNEYGQCLHIKRTKTKTEVYIPLLEKAQKIIDKYSNDPKAVRKGVLLPVININAYNDHLDLIQHACSIEKKIRSHVGRHTAATFFLNTEMPEKVICRALGISSVEILLKVYGKLHNKTVSHHFNILNNNTK